MTVSRRTAAMAASRMKSWFPTTTSPLIVSAPMAFVTNVQLASEVSRVGGLGFIQGGRDFSAGSPALKKLDEDLSTARQALKVGGGARDTLPIGVGFVAYPSSVSEFANTTTPILQSHRPAAVWLFAPSPSAPTTIADIIQSLSSVGGEWGLKVVVQVGNVAAARQAAEEGAHIIVAQGIDAGGHQWASGASIVSLVPEVADMLKTEFPDREIGLWAAGGIADGRGVAAALALGAEGAVLGTRFMVATESDTQDYKRQVILSTTDGGATTAKSQIHDHIQGNREWPDVYDGRAVIHPSYQDQQSGISFEENEKRFKAAKEAGEVSRMVTWSGTGVGLIKEALPAADIVQLLREQTLKVIGPLKQIRRIMRCTGFHPCHAAKA
ncbi:2-nitropropane dioxygenase [Truncatella angustata]|uniref:2-nitropropane dioxygenase n=1 Tax=Truncatella angustata TaxID=152316 RepID=A0A9P8UZJ5_9PEZI|nr:2-nitropropane dioxygenase [Truncatella angustata]KAH6661300.1 2-nitropropane dioxygenase [Truncatella angustata]